MKRNNKGFTLVELLAAVVILAILIAVSIPLLTNLFNKSRNKTYINDAKKLISLAEYRVNASSSTIEKPDEGDCILISMLYLESSDFDNPPNEGKYLDQSSYVVVKNKGGNLEYSATIVEKLKKGGYKGVELTKKDNLLKNNSTKYVVNLDSDDVLNVETDVNRGYINEKLGNNYISSTNSISAVYNYPELIDQSSIIGSPTDPRIVFASVSSAENKYFNTLKARLQLKVDDKDTARSDLKVYIAVGTGYSDATTPISYGTGDIFSYDINLEDDYGKTYDGTGVKVYVIVSDPEGHTDRKTLTYKIHQNEVPEIDAASSVTRRDQDVYHGIPKNMLTAKVTLIVNDDIDGNDKLKVCLKESPTDEEIESCENENYHKYYDYFSTANTMEYLFHNCPGGKCRRDGSTHYLTIFVKDSLGGIAKKKFSYTFSINEDPKLTSLSIQSKKEKFTTTGSKTIIVNVTATDDVDRDDQMSVRISDGIGAATYNYAYQPISYRINGNYDGSTRTIKVSIIDSEDASVSDTRSHTLYLNKKPKINSFSIESSGTVCINQALCPPDDGGNKTVNVSLSAEDDIDYEYLMVCFSLVNTSCDSWSSYTNYDNRTNTYTMPTNYDGSTKIVYAFVRDTEQALDMATSEPYTLYTNRAPVLDYAVFNSRTDGRPVSGSLRTIFNINALDDVDNAANLKIQVIEDGVVTLDNAKLSDYINNDNDFRLAGAHDGKKRNIEVKIIDSEGLSDSKTMTYDVYKGAPPTIDLFNVYSRDIACLNDFYCPLEDGGNANAKYIVKASDDIDDNEDIQICVSESNESCTNYSPYTNYLTGSTPKEMTYTIDSENPDTPYDGSTRTIYLYVKDRDGNIVKQSKEYNLYKNKKPVITEGPVITSTEDDPSVHLLSINYHIVAEDDLDENLQIKYCYKLGNTEAVCTEYRDLETDTVLDENFFHTTHLDGQNYKIYSVVKDSYGQETKTVELTYKVYKDITPRIHQYNISSGSRVYKSDNANDPELDSLEGVINPERYHEYTRLNISFSVDDPYDTYSVCVSSDSDTCYDYRGTYEGGKCSEDESYCTKRKTYIISYDVEGFLEDGDHVEYYLFVRDSYHNITKATLFNQAYYECELYNDGATRYEYEFDSEKTHDEYGHNQPISAERCGGKCYYYNYSDQTTNEIFAVYKTKLTYVDKFNSKLFCNADNPNIIYEEMACDFKDCFYANGDYKRLAIGTRVNAVDEPWTARINNNDYICEGYYNLYQIDYQVGKSNVTRTKTNTWICDTAVDNGEFEFDATSDNPIVRVAD